MWTVSVEVGESPLILSNRAAERLSLQILPPAPTDLAQWEAGKPVAEQPVSVPLGPPLHALCTDSERAVVIHCSGEYRSSLQTSASVSFLMGLDNCRPCTR